MNVIDFINKLKINNDDVKSNNILFYLGKFNLVKYNIKRIIKKPLNNYKGGGDGKGNGKINNLEEFIFNDVKFIVRIVHGDATDIKDKTHTIKFVSLDDMHENSIVCAIVNFDYEKKTAFIQSMGDTGNCVFCPSKNINFKVGQILIIMIITLCQEKNNINKIELTDISKFNCFNTFNKKDEYIVNSNYRIHDNFDLKIISTLLKGVPYYDKYDFKPKLNEDKEILKHNKKIFEQKIKLNTLNLKNNIQKYLADLKIITTKDHQNKYLNIINKYVIPLINEYNNKSVDKFFYAILNTNPDNTDDKIILCNIIISFYKKIFNEMNYKKFKHNVFIKEI